MKKENLENFIISSNESMEYSTFNLTSGFYEITYPTSLNVELTNTPDKITIGSKDKISGSFGGYIDELKIMSEPYTDFRPGYTPSVVNRNITVEYLDPNPQCPDSNTNLLLTFDDPYKDQIRNLKRQSFLNPENNLKYKLSDSEVETLSRYLNNEEEFIGKMIDFGFGIEISKRVYYEVHKANGGPIKNIARYYPIYNSNVRYSSDGPNKRFNGSGRFIEKYNISLDNSESYIDKDRFSLEFWISPERDTYLDGRDRVIFDSRSIVKKIKKATFNKFIELDEPARKVLSVKLLNRRDSAVAARYYDSVEIDSISGRLTGGGGVGKDYSLNCVFKNSGKTIELTDRLPVSEAFVEVIYLPKSMSESYISIKKTEYGTLRLDVFDGVSNYILEKRIRWLKNSWHRVVMQYSRGDKHLSLIIDGESTELSSGLFPTLNGVFGKINIGSDFSGDNSANSKIANFRISKIVRYKKRSSVGSIIDPIYNRNTSIVTPVSEDSDTKIMFDFELSKGIDNNFSVLQNPITSIYNFDVNISDNYDVLDDEAKYNLLEDLINRLKPSHSDAKIKAYDFRC
jgi:hypothetical protein